jgi:hypothetical protein
MRYLQPLLVAVTLAVGPFSSAWAHHSRANFDLDTQIEFQGVITEFSWRNPHTFAKLEVTTESGETKELLMELNSISVLSREGWTRETLKVGDEVTVFANPDRNSSKNLYYSNYFVLPDGNMIASAPGTAPNSEPRQRQQVDQTASSMDFSGIWRSEGGRFGSRGGTRGGNRQDNGNTGAASPRTSLGGQTQAVGLPVTALGQAELDAWNVEDTPSFRCISKTPPWLFSGVGAHKIIRESDEKIIIRHEILDVERIIHLGTTEHDTGIEPSHLGDSIAWFDGETLVVDTANFAPAQWGIGSGVSSSAEKHLTERFTLLDDGRRLRLDYTIEDPVYLTEPVSMSQTFSINPDYPWQDEYGCDPEASSRHLVDE